MVKSNPAEFRPLTKSIFAQAPPDSTFEVETRGDINSRGDLLGMSRRIPSRHSTSHRRAEEDQTLETEVQEVSGHESQVFEIAGHGHVGEGAARLPMPLKIEAAERQTRCH